MRLTAKVKLQPTETQHAALLLTMEKFNAACTYTAKVAYQGKTFKQFDLHKLTYKELREKYDLSSQMAVRAIAKVADAYKVGKRSKRTFQQHGAAVYDSRILSWRLTDQTVSILTLGGRERIPFLAGRRHRELLQTQRGESDLCLIGGSFYLFTTCDVDTPEPDDVTEYLGVDTGVKNIAADSDGVIYSSDQINGLRKRHAKLRAKLQSKGTKSAKRLLKKRRHKETRFAKDVNHQISKKLVQKAKDTGRGIAVEELTGIRDRVTVRRKQRRQHSSWAFADLREKIQYKADLAGVPVIAVDPRYTSQMCPSCGHTSKSNRKSQAVFLCIECGCSGHADVIAATNISGRAVVNQPHISVMVK